MNGLQTCPFSPWIEYRTPGSAHGNDKGRAPGSGNVGGSKQSVSVPKPRLDIHKLSEQQTKAVKVWSGGMNFSMRRILRGGVQEYDSEMVRNAARDIKSLVNDFEPTTRDEVLFRGIKLTTSGNDMATRKLLDKVKPGDVIPIDDTICGWSPNVMVGAHFAWSPQQSPDKGYVFVLEKGRKTTAELSTAEFGGIYSHEKEVLIDCSNRKFRVTKREIKSRGGGRVGKISVKPLTLIYLKEDLGSAKEWANLAHSCPRIDDLLVLGHESKGQKEGAGEEIRDITGKVLEFRTPDSAQGNDRGRLPGSKNVDGQEKEPAASRVSLKKYNFDTLSTKHYDAGRQWTDCPSPIRTILRASSGQKPVYAPNHLPKIYDEQFGYAQTIYNLVHDYEPETRGLDLYRGMVLSKTEDSALISLLRDASIGDEILIDKTIYGWSKSKETSDVFATHSTSDGFGVRFKLLGGRKKTAEFDIGKMMEKVSGTPNDETEEEVLVDCAYKKFRVLENREGVHRVDIVLEEVIETASESAPWIEYRTPGSARGNDKGRVAGAKNVNALPSAEEPEVYEWKPGKFKTINDLTSGGAIGGVNCAFIVTTDKGEKGIFKPVAGESAYSSLNINREAFGADREVVASVIDSALGLNVVPKTGYLTVERSNLWSPESEDMHGSFQQFVGKSFNRMPRPDDGMQAVEDIAFLDMVLGQGDRHWQNWRKGEGKQLWATDNGYSMPGKDANFHEFRSCFVDAVRDAPIPQRLMGKLDSFEKKLPQIRAIFGDKIKERVWEELDRRIHVIKTAKTYGPTHGSLAGPWISKHAGKANFDKWNNWKFKGPAPKMKILPPGAAESVIEFRTPDSAHGLDKGRVPGSKNVGGTGESQKELEAKYGARIKGYTATDSNRIKEGVPASVQNRDQGSDPIFRHIFAVTGLPPLPDDNSTIRSKDSPQQRQGFCFRLAANFVADNPGWELCHATLYPRIGPFENKIYFHGYAEKEGVIYDPVFNRFFNKEVYHKYYSTTDIRTYSRDKMLKRMLKEKNWGPWD
jgi:hypothetical protein